ncbi:unnamed protein product [Lupinus luteus]|uniref:Uncharacterized protein n=1 Tax=Lupinus luteus TaxID=3873 RepID=A0AAV1WB64_LUPLU
MSCIDKFLISFSWANKWPSLIQKGLSREVSDHCHIVLYDNFQGWGPKPFRIINVWFGDDDFVPFVEKVWVDLSITGWKMFVL